MSTPKQKNDIGSVLFQELERSKHDQVPTPKRESSGHNGKRRKEPHSSNKDPDYCRDIPVRAPGQTIPSAPATSSTPRDKPRVTFPEPAPIAPAPSVPAPSQQSSSGTPRTKSQPRDKNPLRTTYEKAKALEVKVNESLADDMVSGHVTRFVAECTTLLVEDCDYALEKSVPTRLWKTIYVVIEHKQKQIRKAQKHLESADGSSKKAEEDLVARTQAFLGRFIDDSIRSYHDILARVTKQHEAAVDACMGAGVSNNPSVICHHCLIALGDLSRYAKEWERAEFFYNRAILLLPFVGRAHNQLAIVAAHTFQHTQGNYWLTLMYQYFRSVASPEPFPARENLITFFEKNRMTDVEMDKSSRTQFQDLDVTLIKFVRLHGILFSRVSLETFDAVWQQCLTRLNRLGPGGSLAGMLVLRMILCAIFIVHDTLPVAADLTSKEGSLSSSMTLACSYALSMCFDLAVFVVHASLSSGERLMDLLPSLAVFGDWLAASPALLTIKSESVRCFWEAIAALLNATAQASPSPTVTGDEVTNELAEIRGFIHFPSTSNVSAIWTGATLSPPEAYEASIMRIRRFASWALQNKALFQDPATLAYSTTPIVPVAAAQPTHRVLVLGKATVPAAAGSQQQQRQQASTNEPDSAPDKDNVAIGVGAKDTTDPASGANSPKETSTSNSNTNTNLGKETQSKLTQLSLSDPSSTTCASCDPDASVEPKPKFAMQVVSVDTKHLSDLRQRLTQRTQTVTTKPLIVVDGPNVAMRHGKQKAFSSLGIKLCADHWQREGHKVVVFLPDYYLDYRKVGENKRAKNAGYAFGAQKFPDDIGLLNGLVDAGVVVPTPAQDYDDSYCIKYAHRHGGYIVSNDRYKDSKAVTEESADMRYWISAHLISYTFVVDEFLPNPDFAFGASSSS